MGAKRLQNAAEAAGFAMVNPDDFAAEAQAQPVERQPKPNAHANDTNKTWFSWDMARLTGTKATA